MKVTFNSKDAQTFRCDEPIELKTFVQGKGAGWLITFHIVADNITPGNLDNILTPESASVLTFITENGKEKVVTGYTSVRSCSVKHGEKSDIAEIQLSKGVVENG